ncbi:MAG: DUF1059 domain-containing protein [SAR202 cluster bacterium]|jgi:predicted small metal-binding protein|nr:DUF1059 domain-containing protein [SAR202 cluster bacterium]MDP7102654.1 DUF1059 domain-containing protein [SAR202 cluster bacterium]MDP7224434.1 DUF1059 domain-containing protein [SAR202 cluster bacterium]|tara:strand:- start:181 stop:357 length:177 start_codon:yes stop_codon:yes gene_type:complete
MAQTYACRDVGADRDWKAIEPTEDELIATVAAHAAKVHPEDDLTPEVWAEVRSVIIDE